MIFFVKYGAVFDEMLTYYNDPTQKLSFWLIYHEGNVLIISCSVLHILGYFTKSHPATPPDSMLLRKVRRIIDPAPVLMICLPPVVAGAFCIF